MRPATRSSSPFSRSPGVIGEMRGAFARADATLAHPSTGARAILNPVENSAMVGALHDMALEAIGMRTSPVRCIVFVALLALAARVESATAANERGPKPAVGLRTTGGVACGSDWWRSAEPGQTEARGLIVCPTGTAPASPPPVALMAHSRGGLVVRQLLKDFQSDDRLRRVKWVITLHSPHQGSDLGRYKGKIGAEFADLAGIAPVPPHMKQELKNRL